MEDQIQKPFLELNVETILVTIFEGLAENIDQIHPNFLSKIWTKCIERTVLLYCKCLLLTADKKNFKKQDVFRSIKLLLILSCSYKILSLS